MHCVPTHRSVSLLTANMYCFILTHFVVKLLSLVVAVARSAVAVARQLCGTNRQVNCDLVQ